MGASLYGSKTASAHSCLRSNLLRRFEGAENVKRKPKGEKHCRGIDDKPTRRKSRISGTFGGTTLDDMKMQ